MYRQQKKKPMMVMVLWSFVSPASGFLLLHTLSGVLSTLTVKHRPNRLSSDKTIIYNLNRKGKNYIRSNFWKLSQHAIKKRKENPLNKLFNLSNTNNESRWAKVSVRRGTHQHRKVPLAPPAPTQPELHSALPMEILWSFHPFHPSFIEIVRSREAASCQARIT